MTKSPFNTVEYDFSKLNIFEYLDIFSERDTVNLAKVAQVLDKVVVGGVHDLPIDMLPQIMVDVATYVNSIFTDYNRE